jgi:hypothetical protein
MPTASLALATLGSMTKMKKISQIASFDLLTKKPEESKSTQN